MKVKDKFCLLRCFLGPEITYTVHFCALFCWCSFAELRLEWRLSFLCFGGNRKIGKGRLFCLVAREACRFAPVFLLRLAISQKATVVCVCMYVVMISKGKLKEMTEKHVIASGPKAL